MQPRAFEATKRLVKKYSPRSLLLAGTGETTFAKNWTDLCRPFLALEGTTKALNTNLARGYSDSELDSLLGFDQLMVSIDTSSPETLRVLRSKSDLKTIVYNLISLRARGAAAGGKIPKILVNCTVTTRNRSELLGLAFLCAQLKVDRLQFSDVTEYPHAVHELEIRSACSLEPEQRLAVLKGLFEAREVCIENGVGFGIQPELEAGLRHGVSPETKTRGGYTRICHQPWTRLNVAADGQYFPCCVTEQPSLGQIELEQDPANSQAIREYREKLLKGEMPQACRSCTNAPLGEVQELVDWVSRSASVSGRNHSSRIVAWLRRGVRRATSRNRRSDSA